MFQETPYCIKSDKIIVIINNNGWLIVNTMSVKPTYLKEDKLIFMGLY